SLIIDAERRPVYDQPGAMLELQVGILAFAAQVNEGAVGAQGTMLRLDAAHAVERDANLALLEIAPLQVQRWWTDERIVVEIVNSDGCQRLDVAAHVVRQIAPGDGDLVL